MRPPMLNEATMLEEAIQDEVVLDKIEKFVK